MASILVVFVLASLMVVGGKRSRGQKDAGDAGKGSGKGKNKDAGEGSSSGKGKGKGKSKKQDKPPFDLPNERKPKTLDEKRFSSMAAQEEYFKMKDVRRVYVAERGIRPEHLDDDRVGQVLDFYGWGTMAEHRKENASMVLALEVYANLLHSVDVSRVFVRGKYVDFSAHAINRHYGLRDEGEAHVAHLNPMPWDSLCGPDGGELSHRDRLELHAKYLLTPWKALAQVWHGRVKPSQREHFINRDSFEFIHWLALGKPVNVGQFIEYKMRDIVRNEGMAITYLHLIRYMCEAAGVKIANHELSFKPGGAFQVIDYEKRRDDVRAGVAPRAILHVAPEDGQFIMTVPPLIPQPPPPPQQGDVGGNGDDRQDDEVHPVVDRDNSQQPTSDPIAPVMDMMRSFHLTMMSIQHDVGYTREAVQSLARGLAQHHPEDVDFQLPPYHPYQSAPPEE